MQHGVCSHNITWVNWDGSSRNQVDLGASLLVNKVSDTWFMAIDLASSFFSIPTRKEDQKHHSHERKNNIHSILLQPMYLTWKVAISQWGQEQDTALQQDQPAASQTWCFSHISCRPHNLGGVSGKEKMHCVAYVKPQGKKHKVKPWDMLFAAEKFARKKTTETKTNKHKTAPGVLPLGSGRGPTGCKISTT